MAVTGTTFTKSAGTANTAELRAIGAQFSTAVASAGMTQTADTGQINWTTVTWVGGSQTWGYEIWRFNDALQATKPFFLKIIYTQPTSMNMFAFNVQMGTGTDGAGNLTSLPNTNVSVTSTAQVVYGASTIATTVGNFYIYGDGSSLVLAVHVDRIGTSGSGYGGFFFCERTRHTDGTALGDGFVGFWVMGTLGTSIYSQVVMYTSTLPQTASTTGGTLFYQGTLLPASGILGTDMWTAPAFTGYAPRLGAPSQMLIGVWRTDMPYGSTFVCQHYGAPRTFVMLQFASNTGFGTGLHPALRIT